MTQRKLKRKVLWWILETEFDCVDGGHEAKASSPACLSFALFIFPYAGLDSIMQPHLWMRQKSAIISTSLFSDGFFFKRMLKIVYFFCGWIVELVTKM